MRKVLFLVPLMLTFSASALAGEMIGRVPCNQADLDALHGADRAAVTKFVNDTRPHGALIKITAVTLSEFGWADVGEGKGDLLVLFDWSGRGYSNTLSIYSCGGAGELNIQEIDGWKMGNLKQMARDLNGDGKDELIVPTELGAEGLWQPLMAMPVWPAVYRLQKGRYVKDSRDFPNYYDKEVLPSLDRNIPKYEARIPKEPYQQETVAVLELEKYKILRVLGRNPAAGLRHAYRWMKSDDPTLMQCAIATFQDIGGFPKQVHDLRQALPAALNREIAASKGRRPVQPAPRSAVEPPPLPGPPTTTAPPPRPRLGVIWGPNGNSGNVR
jgi:hypothetical protein